MRWFYAFGQHFSRLLLLFLPHLLPLCQPFNQTGFNCCYCQCCCCYGSLLLSVADSRQLQLYRTRLLYKLKLQKAEKREKDSQRGGRREKREERRERSWLHACMHACLALPPSFLPFFCILGSRLVGWLCGASSLAEQSPVSRAQLSSAGLSQYRIKLGRFNLCSRLAGSKLTDCFFSFPSFLSFLSSLAPVFLSFFLSFFLPFFFLLFYFAQSFKKAVVTEGKNYIGQRMKY